MSMSYPGASASGNGIRADYASPILTSGQPAFTIGVRYRTLRNDDTGTHVPIELLDSANGFYIQPAQVVRNGRYLGGWYFMDNGHLWDYTKEDQLWPYAGTWTTVVIRANAGFDDLSFYVASPGFKTLERHGVDKSSTTIGGTGITRTYIGYDGRWNGGHCGYMNVADFCMWDTELSDADVYAYLHATSLTSAVSSSSIIAHFPLTDDAETHTCTETVTLYKYGRFAGAAGTGFDSDDNPVGSESGASRHPRHPHVSINRFQALASVTGTTPTELTKTSIPNKDLVHGGLATGDDVVLFGNVGLGGNTTAMLATYGFAFGTTFAGRTEMESTQLVQEPEIAGGGNTVPNFVLASHTLAAGEHFYAWAKSDNASWAAYASGEYLHIAKVDGTRIQLEETTHTGAASTTWETDGASKSLPANTNGYILIAGTRWDSGSVSATMSMRITDTSAAVSDEITYEAADTAEEFMWGQYVKVDPSSTTTYRVEYKSGTASTHECLGTKLVILDLDEFDDSFHVSNTTPVTLTKEAYVDILTFDPTVPEEGLDYCVLQQLTLEAKSTDQVSIESFQDTYEVASYPYYYKKHTAPHGTQRKTNNIFDAYTHLYYDSTNGRKLKAYEAYNNSETDIDAGTVTGFTWNITPAAGGTVHTKVLTDSATISENPEPRRYRDKELSDAETLEDAIKRIYSWRKELSDTVEVDKGEPPRRKVAATVLDAFWNLTDTAVAQIIEAGSVEVRQLLDSLTPLNDSHIKEFLRFREALDTLGLTDTLRRALNRKMGDAVAVVSDTTSLRRDRLRRIADELDVLDALDPRRSRFKTISETLLVTELPTRRAIYRRLLDVLVTTDNRIAQYIPAEGGTVIGKVLSDTILLPDDLMVQRQFARELLETLELADLANAVTTRERVLSEATSAVDSALKFLDRRRVLAETAITLSDSAHLGPSDRLRQMLDVFDVFDAFEAYRQRYRVLIESGIGVSDEAIATYLAYTRVRVRPVVGLRRPINFKDR